MKLKTTIRTLATVLVVALCQLAQAKTDNVPGVSAQPDSYFYTGKPYDADLGAYTFAYRAYDPQINRWTTADPSGFPDGANNTHYSPIPTSQLDAFGLWVAGTHYIIEGHSDYTDRAIADGATDWFVNHNAPLSAALVNRIINGTASTLPDYEIGDSDVQKIEGGSEFQSVRDWVQGRMQNAGGGSAVSFQPLYDNVSVDLESDYDLAHAIAHATLELTGQLTSTWDTSLHMWGYNGNLSVSFTDPYDFSASGEYHVDCFAQLQNHGWISNFSVTGNWNAAFSGTFE